MATKRTGHTGSPRQPGQRYPIELLYQEVRKDIAATARAKGMTSYEIIKQRYPDAYRVSVRSEPTCGVWSWRPR